MNDRYLFKAKRIDNGEWVVGLLLQHVLPINDIALQVVALFIALGLSELTIRWIL